MNASPLQVLRLAVPGQPSGSKIAERVGCSRSMLTMFELGQHRLSDEYLKAYAREVRSTAAEVQRRYLEARLGWLEQQIRLTRAELSERGVTKRTGRRVGSAA